MTLKQDSITLGNLQFRSAISTGFLAKCRVAEMPIAAKTVCMTGSLRDKDTTTCDGWQNVGRGKVFHSGYKPRVNEGRDQEAKLNAADHSKQS